VLHGFRTSPHVFNAHAQRKTGTLLATPPSVTRTVKRVFWPFPSTWRWVYILCLEEASFNHYVSLTSLNTVEYYYDIEITDTIINYRWCVFFFKLKHQCSKFTAIGRWKFHHGMHACFWWLDIYISYVCNSFLFHSFFQKNFYVWLIYRCDLLKKMFSEQIKNTSTG